MKSLTLALLSCAAIGFAGCDVDVQDEGELPDVDMQVEEGRMPDVDVTGPEVDVDTEERQVTVPDVDVHTEERTIDVPDVDVTIPDENDNEPAGTTPE